MKWDEEIVNEFSVSEVGVKWVEMQQSEWRWLSQTKESTSRQLATYIHTFFRLRSGG